MVSRPNSRLDRWFRRHPRITLAIGVASLGWVTVWEIVRIAAARHTVPSGWAAGLATGVTASLTMTATLILAIRLSRRVDGNRNAVVWSLTLLIALTAVAALLFTAPSRVNVNRIPYVVTTGSAVAGMAYAATFAALCLALVVRAVPRVIRVHAAAPMRSGIGRAGGGQSGVHDKRDPELLTALVGPCDSGWDVSWVSDRRSPGRLSAATLTEVADLAEAAAVQYYLRRPPRAAAAADFQIALLPHHYAKGPIFEISGGPGGFTAADKASGRVLRGATLEDLLRAAESAGDMRAGEYMFRWTRPIMALSPRATAPRPGPRS